MSHAEEFPLVSVCVVTYNHEYYLRECLQSIVEQETTFRFEVIVGDDASPDGTAKILSEFADRYPAKIVPVYHQKNIGATKNYFSVHNLARGKYIAHCDGDDYWLPGKLQHQVEILESDESIAVVAESGQALRGRHRFDMTALLSAMNPVIHSSKVYRRDNSMTRDSDMPLLDFYFNVEHGHRGDTYLEERKFTIYRENVGVMRTMGYRFYTLNCQVADRAFSLGAPREVAYRAARNARFSLIKNSLFDKDWNLLCQLLVPNEIEKELGGPDRALVLERLLRVRPLRYLLHYLLRAKRSYV